MSRRPFSIIVVLIPQPSELVVANFRREPSSRRMKAARHLVVRVDPGLHLADQIELEHIETVGARAVRLDLELGRPGLLRDDHGDTPGKELTVAPPLHAVDGILRLAIVPKRGSTPARVRHPTPAPRRSKAWTAPSWTPPQQSRGRRRSRGPPRPKPQVDHA